MPHDLAATGRLHADGSAPDLDGPAAKAVEAEEPRLPDQVRVRMAKLKALQDKGIDAYPVGRPPTHTVAAGARRPSDDVTLTVAGRILRTRDYGGVVFAQLRDWSGDVQLLLDKSALDGDAEDFAGVDLGDLVEVGGHMGYSKNGTRSLLVEQWRMLGKCLRPLPDKRKGLTGPGGPGAGPLRRPGDQPRSP